MPKLNHSDLGEESNTGWLRAARRTHHASTDIVVAREEVRRSRARAASIPPQSASTSTHPGAPTRHARSIRAPNASCALVARSGPSGLGASFAALTQATMSSIRRVRPPPAASISRSISSETSFCLHQANTRGDMTAFRMTPSAIIHVSTVPTGTLPVLACHSPTIPVAGDSITCTALSVSTSTSGSSFSTRSPAFFSVPTIRACRTPSPSCGTITGSLFITTP